MSFAVFQILFLVATACLLILSAVRWARTPESHPEHAVRGDMTRLLAVALLGLVGSAGRGRFALGSAGFWICSGLLLPVALAAVLLLRRLFLAYRGHRSGRA